MRRSILLVSSLVLTLAGCHDELPTGAADRPGILPHFALVPISGGTVNAPIVAIDVSPGYQDGPRVSGDLMCYRDSDANQVRYYRFSTGANTALLNPAVGSDGNCDIGGSRIVFEHVPATNFDLEIHAFDVSSGIFSIVAAQAGARYTGPAIGSNTVAFYEDFRPTSNTSNVRVADLGTPGSQLLSAAGVFEDQVMVAPNGNLVVWRRFDAFGFSDVMKAVRASGTWSAPQVVGNAPGVSEDSPDTDGTHLVYVFDGNDLVIQDVNGLLVQSLAIPGEDVSPSIHTGVIAFVNFDATTGQADLMVYVIATNRLFRITNDAAIEARPDVNLLSNGNIRVVWQVIDPATDNFDIYATTFNPGGGPTYSFGGFLGLLKKPLLNPVTAGSSLAVLFSLGGDFGLNIFASGSPFSQQLDCVTGALTGVPTPTHKPGGSALTYDPSLDLYTYVWKTGNTWGGTCRRFAINFADGSTASVDLRFR